MKAILVDPFNRTIEMVDHKGGLQSIYNLLDCTTFEAPIQYDNGDAMYVDEEAWLNVDDNKLAGFTFPNIPHVILGKGLIVGTDHEGADVDCKSVPTDFSDVIWKTDPEMRQQGRIIGVL